MSLSTFLTLGLSLIIALSVPIRAIAQDGEYVFILAAHDSPYWNTLGEGVKDAAKAKGITPVIYEAQNGRDTEGELNICLTAILRKPKIIVMGSLNASIGIQCFKQAISKGIIVADVDANLSVEEAAKAGIPLAFSIGSDNYLAGEEAANYVISSTKNPALNILIIEGAAGSVPSHKRVAGFTTKIKQLLPRANIVASISADWDRLKAMDITLDVLQRQANLDVIYAANDTMALGAAEAVRNLARTTQVKIIGVDGTADARKAIMDGRLTASVAQLPYLMGMRSVELAIDAVTTHKTGVSEITMTPVLTRDLIETNNEPALQYVR